MPEAPTPLPTNLGLEEARPQSPRRHQEKAPVIKEEDKVEVIEREEARPQGVRIFRQRGSETVVVEVEEDTP